MKLIFENWRQYQEYTTLEEDLKNWLIAENYLDEDVILSEISLSGAWGSIKRKFESMKEWTYEKYLNFIKPLLEKLINFIGTLRKKRLLGKWDARQEIQAINLFKTKKYIKLGAIFITGLLNALVSLVNIPEKLQMLEVALSAIREGKWSAAFEVIDVPFKDVKELIKGLGNFGKDMKATSGLGGPTLGQGEFEYAEE